jgi:excisionase family DNA binding protein
MSSSQGFSEYLTVGEAAQVLGVSPWTLRNWDKSGRLKPARHPKNGYRIYRHEDLQAVLNVAPPEQFPEFEHLVQFYEHDSYLEKTVADYVASGLRNGIDVIVVPTPGHLKNIEKLLAKMDVDLAGAKAEGRYVALDAAETLAQFMVDGVADLGLFHETVGAAVARMTEGGKRIRAFGEMVAVLWGEGNRSAAIRLEQLWNEVAKVHPFTLFCAYPLKGFTGDAQTGAFGEICGCHSRVIPAESYSNLSTEKEKQHAISQLQQRALSLEAEIAHRKELEKVLVEREYELAQLRGGDAVNG